MREKAQGRGLLANRHEEPLAPKEDWRHVEATFSPPLLAHAPMEPQNATAWFRDGGLEDDLTHDFYRPPLVSRLEAWLDPAGQVLGLRHHQVIASISQQRNPARAGEINRGTLEGAEPLCAFKAFELEQTLVPVPVPLGAWRWLYASQNCQQALLRSSGPSGGCGPLALAA